MAEKIPIEFAYSFLEHKSFSLEPLFGELLGRNSSVVKSLYAGLKEWGLALENIVFKQQVANAGDIQINFNLQRIATTVQVGLAGLTVFVTNPDWSQAGRIIQVSSSCLEAVRGAAKTELASHQLSLAMHIIPKGRSRKEIVERFVRLEHSSIAHLGKIKAFGFSAAGENGILIVEGSALYDEALFVKIVRTFSGETSIPEMASWLKKDEDQVLNLLELQEDA